MPAAAGPANIGEIEHAFNRSSAAREAGLLYQIEWSEGYLHHVFRVLENAGVRTGYL